MMGRPHPRLPRASGRRGALALIAGALILVSQPAAVGHASQTVQGSDGSQVSRQSAVAAATATLIDTRFTTGQSGPWPLGHLALNGATASLSHGSYVLSNQNGYSAMAFPKGLKSLGDGTISATFHLPTTGRVGVVARYASVGAALNYADCWLDAAGKFGCDIWINGTSTSLPAPRAPALANNLNHTLALTLQGTAFSVAVDGRQAYQGHAAHPLASGQWGLYVIGKFSEGVVEGSFTRATITPASVTPAPPPRLPASIWAWGANAEGELGDGKQTSTNAPIQTLDLHDVQAISSRFGHALALLHDGTVWAWGINDSGQLGNGTTANSSTPLQVIGLRHITAVASGAGHSLALRDDGTVWAWGSNADGQLGNGTPSSGSRLPAQVKGLPNIKAIAAGDGFSLALGRDGTVWSWGTNANGELGNGTTIDTSTPGQIPGLNNVQSIVAGLSHSLAVKGDGTLWAWGANADGQLGTGSTAASSAPIEVKDLGGVRTMATGNGFSLAVKIDGTVWAWGAGDSGELGTGDSAGSPIPTQVKSLAGIQAVAAGDAFGLALGRDGSVWSWGANASGQLGNGGPAGSNTPRRIQGLANVQAVAAGSLYGLALVK